MWVLVQWKGEPVWYKKADMEIIKECLFKYRNPSSRAAREQDLSASQIG